MRTLLTIAAVALLVSAAHAQDRKLEPGAPEGAEQRYQIGVQAYLDQRFDDASREFQVAFTMFPRSARLAYNLARSLERGGQVEAALRYYGKYVELAPNAEDKAAVQATMKGLQALLDSRKGTLKVTSSPDGAEVKVDGVPLGSTPLSTQVAPGEHGVHLSLAGYQSTTRQVVVKAESSATVSVALAADGLDWKPIAGWSGVGLGVVLAGVGAKFSLDASATADEAREYLRGEGAGELKPKYNDAKNNATGLYVAAGVAVAAGVTLLLWPSDAPPAVSAGLGPDGLSVMGRF